MQARTATTTELHAKSSIHAALTHQKWWVFAFNDNQVIGSEYELL